MRENYHTSHKIPVVHPGLAFGQMPILVCLFLGGHITVMIFALQEKDSNFGSINIIGDERKTT